MYLQKNDKLLVDSTDENKLWIRFKNNNKELYNNTINGNIRINDFGILEIKRKSDLTDDDMYVAIVPSIIRGKLLAYAHNNPTTQHFRQTSTYDNLTQWWWRDDARHYSACCPICQFIKGEPDHKHPFTHRQLPKQKQKLLADFMGPFFKKYYILVLIDYATGFTVLEPCTNCGAIVTTETIINKWVPYFGLPLEFDCMGSAFISKVFKTLKDGSEAVLTSSSLNLARDIGHSLQLMECLKPISHNAFASIKHSFYFYLYHVFIWLGVNIENFFNVDTKNNNNSNNKNKNSGFNFENIFNIFNNNNSDKTNKEKAYFNAAKQRYPTLTKVINRINDKLKQNGTKSKNKRIPNESVTGRASDHSCDNDINSEMELEYSGIDPIVITRMTITAKHRNAHHKQQIKYFLRVKVK